ncbi:hypothetical protein FSP39_020217 [Pinctada imbricata]|uniref:Alpha-glucosidase n=1 Tax=Pinctada imbricata TaxID=66713 RepID=A0AA88YM25_PINIB|nr:hypothetical protein FSP39_020217 [Pinctada imbricata]
MKVALPTGLCLLVAMCQCAAKNFSATVAPDNSQFSVSVGRNVVIGHSSKSAMLYVGLGQTVFSEALGNFHIRDYIQDRMGLYQFNYTKGTNQDSVLLQGGPFKVKVTLSTKNNQDLVLSFQNMGQNFTHAWLRLSATADEKIFGGGEQFSHLNLRESSYHSLEFFSSLRADDKVYPMWTREQGVGRDKSSNTTFFADLKTGGGGDFSTTYFPQPTFFSSRNFYMHFTGTGYMTFDFGVPQFHEVMMKGSTINDIYFNSGTSLLVLVQQVSQMLGRMPALPSWAYDGIIMGVQGGTEVMMKRYDEAKAAGVRIRGLWIQDWAGILKTSFGKRLFWNWKWNTTIYAGLDQKIKDLKNDGVRVTTYINPNLNIYGDLYKNASSQGFVVKNQTGQPYLFNFGEFFCGIIDLTNPSAVQWYKTNIIYPMLDLGIRGWMADFGEYLPADAKMFNGQSGEAVHNTWPVLWAKLNREAVEEKNLLGEVVFWMRAGYTGTSNYTTLLWAGDQNVDFSTGDGLPSTIPAALSAGMVGIGMSHFDIGGYTTFGSLGLKRSEELLLRSAEMAIFTPVMRTHEGNQPTYNVQMYSSSGMLGVFHNNLANYTKSVMNEYTTSGTPAQRPLFLMYPDDTETYKIKYQYMYGPDLLVAPVTRPGVTIWTLYLPKGEQWIYTWNNTVVNPGYVHVDAPLGLPPIFYRYNSSFASLFRTFQNYQPINLPQHTTQTPRNISGTVGNTFNPYVMFLCFILISNVLFK